VKNQRSCLMKIEDGALLVANTGSLFDRLGVISVCASHLGTKQNYKPADTCPDAPDKELIERIRNREIETYVLNVNRLSEDYSGEKETQLDHEGRAIWELLQNADDAMAPRGTLSADLIGVKGLGFKSVLEVTEEPEIYSGEFSFCFSAVKTQKLIKEIIKEIENVPPLTFRIPHKVEPNAVIRELQKDYATIIRLPIRSGKESKVQEWLENLAPECMIFFQHIEVLKIILPNQAPRIYSCRRDKPGVLADCDIPVKEENEGILYQYRLWTNIWMGEGGSKRNSVAISLPLKENKPVCFDRTHPLYVFLPTSEHLPFHVLMHGSFDLEQNRKHVRNLKDHENHRAKFAVLISRILDVIPASIALKAFVPDTEPEKDTVASFLWEAIKRSMSEKEFIPCVGGGKTTPEKARLWKHNLGMVLDASLENVKKLNLAEQELISDEKCKKALKLFGAEEIKIEEYPLILQSCCNGNLDDCKKSLETLHEVIILAANLNGANRNEFFNNCRQVPCWWTENGEARSLSKERQPLIRKNLDESLPDWLAVDILHEELLRLIGNYENEKDKTWDYFLNGFLLQCEKEELMHYVLIPYLEQRIDQQEWWMQHGWEALRQYLAWCKDHSFESTKPMFWEKDRQNRIARTLYLPTDKGWMPALKCYAGKSWDGPDSFDEFFKHVSDRGILTPFENWDESFRDNNPGIVKGKLRYSGVSWEPKVLKFEAKTEQCEIDFNGHPKYPPNCWKDITSDSYYKEYCNSLPIREYYNKNEFEREAKLKIQWAIEYFPDSLPPLALERIKLIKPFTEHIWDIRNMAFTCTRGNPYNDRVKFNKESFAFWQLKKIAWLPCKPSLVHKDHWISPSDGYLPGKGLGGLLPEIDIRLDDNQEGRDIKTLLVNALDVRETLPSETEEIWREWLEKLPGYVADFSDKEKATKSVEKLWKKILTFSYSSKFIGIDKIPSKTWSDENETLVFSPKSEVYWVDKGYLNERSTRNALLRNGYSLFILELQEGERINYLFNIERLSEKIAINYYYEVKSEDLNKLAKERYQERYKALVAVSGSINLPSPDNLLVDVVKNLKLKVSGKDGVEIAKDISRPFWIEEDMPFLIDEDKIWEGFGLALSDSKPVISSLFENILREEKWAGVLGRLREAGVPENTVLQLEQDILIPTPKPEINTPGPSSLGSPPKDSMTKHAADRGDSEYVRHPTEGGEAGKHHINTQARKKKGEEAEDWFREELKNKLSQEWKVSDGPERDEDGFESDIVLRHEQRGAFHIEVKHAEAGELFWSIGEVKKARKNPGCYWMVIIRPSDAQAGYRSIIVEDPLAILKDYDRSGVWLWQGRSDNVTVNEEWNQPEPKPMKEASNFSFQININKLEWDKFPEAIDFLSIKLL